MYTYVQGRDTVKTRWLNYFIQGYDSVVIIFPFDFNFLLGHEKDPSYKVLAVKKIDSSILCLEEWQEGENNNYLFGQEVIWSLE